MELHHLASSFSRLTFRTKFQHDLEHTTQRYFVLSVPREKRRQRLSAATPEIELSFFSVLFGSGSRNRTGARWLMRPTWEPTPFPPYKILATRVPPPCFMRLSLVRQEKLRQVRICTLHTTPYLCSLLPDHPLNASTYSATILIIGTICPRTCQFRCTTFVYIDPRAVNPTPWLILYLVGSRCRIRTHSPGYQKPLRYQLRQSAIELVPVEGNDPTRAFRHEFYRLDRLLNGLHRDIKVPFAFSLASGLMLLPMARRGEVFISRSLRKGYPLFWRRIPVMLRGQKVTNLLFY